LAKSRSPITLSPLSNFLSISEVVVFIKTRLIHQFGRDFKAMVIIPQRLGMLEINSMLSEVYLALLRIILEVNGIDIILLLY
jgi:hypothetical protein